MTAERPPRSVAGQKSATAFRTIGEVSAELGVPQHVLRYWEGRFPQLKPLQRAGNRRHYRQQDVDLLRRIHTLLNNEGYTIRGVQKLLGDVIPVVPDASDPPVTPTSSPNRTALELMAIRTLLVDALRDDNLD